MDDTRRWALLLVWLFGVALLAALAAGRDPGAPRRTGWAEAGREARGIP